MKPLIDALFVESNPIPVKTAMNLMGLEVGELRLPLTTIADSSLNILIKEMESYGLKLRR